MSSPAVPIAGKYFPVGANPSGDAIEVEVFEDLPLGKHEKYWGLRMSGVKKINFYFILSCLIGVLLSYYAYTVEMNVEENHDYVALCDISEHISCTKAFSSEYGRGFGLIGRIFGNDSVLNQPNSFGGIFFYLLLGVLCLFQSKSIVKLQILLSGISNIFSVYLAYILYFVLHDFCVVCVATYVINAINLILSIMKWRRLSAVKETLSSKKKK